jgi:16S rRNA (guanine(527)-N(7))-methyltransferase RsmG
VKQIGAKVACREYWEHCGAIPGLRGWPEAETLIDRYVGLLLAASKRRNLLSASQRNEESLWGHVFDSLQALSMVAESGGVVLDAGSGNGLPGVPLAVALPDVKFLLVERTIPKTEFLELAAAKCGLRNVRVRAADLTESLIESIEPGLLLLRAVVSADSGVLPRWLRALRYPWVVFATASNSASWVGLAEASGFVVRDELQYHDMSGDRSRVLLKFAKL